MRGLLGLAAAALAGLAAVIASLNGGVVPFFVGLMFLGTVDAWAAHPPFIGQRRWLARGGALLWLSAAVWVDVLLVMYVTAWHASGPDLGPEATYLGLPGAVYHLLGLNGGLVLVLISAFGLDRWFNRAPS